MDEEEFEELYEVGVDELLESGYHGFVEGPSLIDEDGNVTQAGYDLLRNHELQGLLQ